MEQKFYICEHCGNIITKIKDSGAQVSCCGQEMTELIPGTIDASLEKHIPVYEVKDGKVHVTIGEVLHPMEEEHHIEWIYIKTKQGDQIKKLNPGDEPKRCFAICDDDEVEAVYEYCNIHGLWRA